MYRRDIDMAWMPRSLKGKLPEAGPAPLAHRVASEHLTASFATSSYARCLLLLVGLWQET